MSEQMSKLPADNKTTKPLKRFDVGKNELRSSGHASDSRIFTINDRKLYGCEIAILSKRESLEFDFLNRGSCSAMGVQLGKTTTMSPVFAPKGTFQRISLTRNSVENQLEVRTGGANDLERENPSIVEVPHSAVEGCHRNCAFEGGQQ